MAGSLVYFLTLSPFLTLIAADGVNPKFEMVDNSEWGNVDVTCKVTVDVSKVTEDFLAIRLVLPEGAGEGHVTYKKSGWQDASPIYKEDLVEQCTIDNSNTRCLQVRIRPLFDVRGSVVCEFYALPDVEKPLGIRVAFEEKKIDVSGQYCMPFQ